MRVSAVRKRTAALLLIAALTLPLALASGCGVLNGSKTADESVSGYSGTGAMSTGAPPATTDSYSTVTEQALTPEADMAQREGSTGSGEDASTVAADQRLVIRTVDMRVEVDDVDTSVTALRKAVESRKGVVTDLQISTDEGIPIYRPYVEGSATGDGAALSGYMTVRVPADSLEAFIAEASKLGKVLRQAENESDVTQQHIDLKARLTNLQATETQLRDFFAKAKNVTEMLAIQEQLTSVRGEIEAMQAEIAYLERQAAMSTVTVELIGPTPVVRPKGETWGFVDALTQAVRSFVNTVNVLIVVTGALLPVVLITLVVFLMVRAILRRKRATRVTTQEAAATPADDDATAQ